MSSKHFVIVGGSHGIGSEITRQLLTQGHELSLLCRSQSETTSLPGVHYVPYDATHDVLDTTPFPDAIDGLVYCPGSLSLRSFRSLKPETFREDFEVHVVGAVRVIQALLPKLMKSPAASIVLFSSVAVSQGLFAHASIAASKGAIEGLTRTLASELSPTIRVNALAPALVATPLTAKFFADPEKAKSLGEKYPLGRTGTTQDLASIAAFLLGDSSSWITGQVIGVDGGMASIRKG